MEAIIYNLYECTVCGYIYDEEKGDEPDIPKAKNLILDSLKNNFDIEYHEKYIFTVENLFDF